MLSNYPALRPSLLLDFANAAAVDPRVTFTRHSRATAFDARGQLRTFDANAPRIDYDPATLACRGLLIEEQRTNSIRTNTMQGAVAGTPGTMPTNWATFTTRTGLTREIVGTGTENGITYIDIRISGTPNTSGTYSVLFETNTGISAANAQNWAQSVYLKLQSGSFSGISSVVQNQDERSTTTYIRTNSSAPITITSQALSTQRFVFSSTLSGGATVAHLVPYLTLTLDGAAIDITLRIGLPQLEQGAFATSVIPTTTAAATRSADVASITGANFSSWFNSTQGTVCAELMRPSLIASTAFANAWSISDNTADERYLVYNTGGSQTMDVAVTDGGVGQATLSAPGVITTNSQIKTAFAYAANDFAWVRDAGTVQTDTSGTLPTVDRLYIGANSVGSGQWTGHIQRIAYYPRRLTNAELLAITA